MCGVRKELAELICYGGAVLKPEKWLAEETLDLATLIRHLDEVPPQAILPLAKLIANGESESGPIALALDVDQVKIEEQLNALCEFGFAEETGNGYRSTAAGIQAFDAIGQRMIARELFEVKARLQQLELLIRRVNNS